MAESEIGLGEQERAARNHRDAPWLKRVTPPFATAIQTLIPSGSRAEILALFGNRVSWRMIVHWRQGTRGMPQWARDIVSAHIAEIAALGPAILNHNRKPPKGTAGTMALRRYRAQKAKGTP